MVVCPANDLASRVPGRGQLLLRRLLLGVASRHAQIRSRRCTRARHRLCLGGLVMIENFNQRKAAADRAAPTRGPATSGDQDPETLVGLIYRIVSDWQCLARTCALLLFLALLIAAGTGPLNRISTWAATRPTQSISAGGAAFGVVIAGALIGQLRKWKATRRTAAHRRQG